MEQTLATRVTAVAETNFRNQRRAFGIKRADRLAHTYLIGKMGAGKSTLIANLGHQDLLHREGFALLDPHGDLTGQVLRLVAEERKADLIYFNVPDTAHPLAFNPLAPQRSAAATSTKRRSRQCAIRAAGSRRHWAQGLFGPPRSRGR